MSRERWETLSGLYEKMRDVFQADYFRAALLSRSLRSSLAIYLGCSRDSILFFDYDERTHTYNPEDDAFKAVSMNGDYVWFVGFGVTLERAPNAFPKTTFQFPVWYHFAENETIIDTSFGKCVLPVGGDNDDFTEACALIYEGLKHSVEHRTNKKTTDKNFGFLNFDGQ